MTGFYLGIFAASVFSSFVLTRYVRNCAMAHGWVAGPDLERHLHHQPLPRLGGVAIVLAFLISIGITSAVSWWYPRLSFGFSPKALLTILLPGLLIFLLGLYDDLHPVGPYFKFAVEVLAGAMLFAGGLRPAGAAPVVGQRLAAVLTAPHPALLGRVDEAHRRPR